METTSKRTPSRCREWERQRRNKFNDAITKLGEVVKAIIKSKDTSGKDVENAQFPKVEIIQKATLCLNNCVLELTQLKAEILALQVKLDAVKEKKTSTDAASQVYIEVTKQDASTQVFIKLKKRTKNGKCVKLMMLHKNEEKSIKQKPVCMVETTKAVLKQPKILPKTKLPGSENTIVVLPASPYIFPQRPILFPSIPPAIVLVNPNMQQISKPSVPIVSRNNGDITKTTMVNILPISAYSHPLSASKIKKNNVKVKNSGVKKAPKKSNTIKKKISEPTKNTDSHIKADHPKDINEIETSKNKELKETQITKEVIAAPMPKNNSSTNVVHSSSEFESKEINTTASTNITKKDELDVTSDDVKKLEISKPIESTDSDETSTKSNKVTVEKSTITITNKVNCIIDKTNLVKDKNSLVKDKENKIPNILDTTLCDGTVEGGNARLELAEEFLAASPTAAFLMSFPLVSGNRADSPADDPQGAVHATTKENVSHRPNNELTPQSGTFFEKTNTDNKLKNTIKQGASDQITKQDEQQKLINEITNKETISKSVNVPITTNATGDNPFLNLPIISTNYTSDTSFGLDLDCNINKSTTSQTTSYVNSNNLFYKSDPFGAVKNNIYSTSGITSAHEFNSLGLYPCAMEKYSSKNKSDYNNVEENLIKMGPSRLTYDIDLGWSHKSFDFVNCATATSTFCKDILTTASAPYSTSYNPFNPEFHVPLVSSSSKKNTSIKTSFVDSISNFYSQPSSLWSDDAHFYSSNNSVKSLNSKPQHYLHLDQMQTNTNIKNDGKTYNIMKSNEPLLNTKPTNMNSSEAQHITEKFTKKSNKMHINWMTSEVRSMQNMNIHPQNDTKGVQKSTFPQLDYKTYNHIDNGTKKQDQTETNYFPFNMHTYPPQTTQEDIQIWPPARPLGTTEVSIEPPPINLPTLVGDLALGPHDKKKNADVANRHVPQTDLQNCGNFLSVTQIMNRSSDNTHTRFQMPNIETPKTIPTKESSSHFTPDTNRKVVTSRLESNPIHPSYVFIDPKLHNTYENNFTQFPNTKIKPVNKNEKVSKTQKNNYSAEALLRGGNCSQKSEYGSSKFAMGTHKYNDYNLAQDNVAQVSHFPSILDYSDNSYATQQFCGTTLYNTTTNTISNSFYSNFMPGNSNLMSSNYASGPFTSDFIDYNQTTECNYTNHKYEELKMRSSNPVVFPQEKMLSNYKGSRRESGSKHKLECSKKESNKKYQSKRAKLNTEVEDWADSTHLLWQNRSTNKRNPHLNDELPLTNYVNNQMTAQYQPDLVNSHLMPSNMQNVGHNVDRSLATFPGTSRANFNLSTIFPEITMKVQ